MIVTVIITHYPLNCYFKLCIWFVLEILLFSPGESEHSQVMAKQGAETSIPPPDAEAGRKTGGSSGGGPPLDPDGPDARYAAARRRPLPYTSPSRLKDRSRAPCRTAITGDCAQRPLWVIPSPPASQSMLSSCLLLLISVRSQLEEGGPHAQPAAPPPLAPPLVRRPSVRSFSGLLQNGAGPLLGV